nr:MAG TPA: hypothetical protein [Caudoviricetes sp.]
MSFSSREVQMGYFNIIDSLNDVKVNEGMT